MRLNTLLFLTLLCTCGRAQQFNTGSVVGIELNRQPFTALTADGDLMVLDVNGTNSLLHRYRDTTRTNSREIKLRMSANNVQQIVFAPDGGLIVSGTKGKKLLLEWFSPELDTAYLSETEITGFKKSLNILTTFPQADGTTLLYFTDTEKTYRLPLRLQRDTITDSPILVSAVAQVIHDRALTAVCRLPNGRMAGLGNDKGTVYLQYFGQNGQAEGNKQTLSSGPFDDAQALAYHPESRGIVVAGTKNNNIATWYLFTLNGKRIPRKTGVSKGSFPGLRIERVITRPDHSLAFMGRQTINGAIPQTDAKVIWLATADAKLNGLEVLATSPDNWRGEEIYLLTGNRLLATGYDINTNSGELILGSDAINEFSPEKPDLTTGSPYLIDQQGDGVLDAGEAASLALPWQSTGDSLRGTLTASLRFVKKITGLPRLITSNVFPVMGSDSDAVHLPLFGGKNLPSGKHEVSIKLTYEGIDVTTINYTLETRAAPQPNVVFAKEQCFISYLNNRDSSSFQRLDTFEVALRVINKGRKTGTGINVKVLPIPHVEFSNYYFEFPDLAPGEYRDTSLKVMAHSYFEYEKLTMNFFLDDDSGANSFVDLDAKLDHVFLMRGDNGSMVLPEFIDYPNGRRGGPSSFFVPDPEPVYTVEMVIPNAGPVEKCSIVSPMLRVPIRVRFTCSQEVSLNSINATIETKSSGEIRTCIGGLTTFDITGPLNSSIFELQTDLPVKKEKETYYVTLSNQDGKEVAKDTLHILPQARFKKRLHICMIAPLYDKEEPTELSVRTMNSLLREYGIYNNKNNRFFTDVVIDTIFNATAANIQDYFDRKKWEVASHKTVSPTDNLYHDYFLFYVVAHGIFSENEFLLYTSNEDKAGQPIVADTISVLHDMVLKFGDLPVNKLYLLDACESGMMMDTLSRLNFSQSIGYKFALRVLAASSKESNWKNEGEVSIFSSEVFKQLERLLSDDMDKDGAVAALELKKAIMEHIKDQLYPYLKTEFSFPDTKIKGYLPKYFKSKNAGLPAYIDYFFEIPAYNGCQ